MPDTTWESLRSEQLRYHDHTWELTGGVDILENGDLVVAEARQTDDVRRRTALLHFGLVTVEGSLNPGELGEHFDRIERVDGGQHLVVKKAGRRYRYELTRLEYE
ncbi:hypothetical protein DVK02_10840 [Halobellus sp. Atlit-31R]|nr:hypothetical protein DVK02_10840 [Halobellus sp. Atlit-31R]